MFCLFKLNINKENIAFESTNEVQLDQKGHGHAVLQIPQLWGERGGQNTDRYNDERNTTPDQKGHGHAVLQIPQLWGERGGQNTPLLSSAQSCRTSVTLSTVSPSIYVHVVLLAMRI